MSLSYVHLFSAVIGFSSTSYSVSEGVHLFASLTIARISGNTKQITNVTFMTVDGTADGMLGSMQITACQEFHTDFQDVLTIHPS